MPDAVQVTMPSDREIRTTRSFDAPAHLVWDAHTKKELVQRWLLGPDGWTMPICEIDFCVGGSYRYGWANPSDGRAFEMNGVFKEITPITRIVHSERFGADEAQVTFELSERGGESTLTMTMAYASKEKRDAAAATGMTDGMEMGYKRLDAMLTTAS